MKGLDKVLHHKLDKISGLLVDNIELLSVEKCQDFNKRLTELVMLTKPKSGKKKEKQSVDTLFSAIKLMDKLYSDIKKATQAVDDKKPTLESAATTYAESSSNTQQFYKRSSHSVENTQPTSRIIKRIKFGN